MGFIARGGDFAQSLRAPVPQPRIAGKLAARSRRSDPRLGALRDQGPLELRDGPQHLQGKHALRRRGINGVAQRPEMRATFFEPLDRLEEVAHRTGEAIEPNHDEDVACPYFSHEARVQDGRGRRRTRFPEKSLCSLQP